MAKTILPPSTSLYPIPAIMATCGDIDGKKNVITLAWAGTVCSEPPMIAIGVRPSRYSYSLIKETGEFVVNIATKSEVAAVDLCGVLSGRDSDKFLRASLTPERAQKVKAPLIKECPVNIECVVRHSYMAGSHEVFIGEVVAVHVDSERTRDGYILPEDAICYHARSYWTLAEPAGSRGQSVSR